MSDCFSEIKEVRFVIKETTDVYVLSESSGDCPVGVQGWHFKSFPKEKSVQEILETEFSKYLEWPLKAP